MVDGVQKMPRYAKVTCRQLGFSPEGIAYALSYDNSCIIIFTSCKGYTF